MKPSEFIGTYNQTDIDLEQNYVQEVFEVKKCVLDAAAVLKGKEVVGDLSANDIFNIFLPTNHIFDMMNFLNTFLINESHWFLLRWVCSFELFLDCVSIGAVLRKLKANHIAIHSYQWQSINLIATLSKLNLIDAIYY